MAAEPHDPHGRIGYGRYGRYTPLALALVLIVSVVLIGRYQGGADGPTTGIGRLVGKPAPDVTLTTLDGTPLRLADLRGDVVVLNFWASWCVPCWDEATAFQAVHEEASRAQEPLTVIGVGVRTDSPDGAAAFVRDLGLTYPIGRDTATEAPGLGPIQLAFGIPETYPNTVFLRPDGVIDDVHLGPLDADQIRDGIDAARTAAGAT